MATEDVLDEVETACDLADMQQDIQADARALDIIAAKLKSVESSEQAYQIVTGMADDLRRLESLMVALDLWQVHEPEDN